MLIEGDLVGAVAPPPESMTVPRLVDGDPIDPGPQARLAAEAMNGPEHAQEDFLRQVERFVAVAQEVDRKLDDHPLVLGDEIGARRLIAGRTPLNQRSFAPADVRPADDPGLFHRRTRIHYTKLDPGLADGFPGGRKG